MLPALETVCQELGADGQHLGSSAWHITTAARHSRNRPRCKAMWQSIVGPAATAPMSCYISQRVARSSLPMYLSLLHHKSAGAMA